MALPPLPMPSLRIRWAKPLAVGKVLIAVAGDLVAAGIQLAYPNWSVYWACSKKEIFVISSTVTTLWEVKLPVQRLAELFGDDARPL